MRYCSDVNNNKTQTNQFLRRCEYFSICLLKVSIPDSVIIIEIN